MTAEEILHEVAMMPEADWLKIQAGISELLAFRFSDEESSEILAALDEAETELRHGEGLSPDQMRARFGLS